MADDLTTILTDAAQAAEDEQRLTGNVQDAPVVLTAASVDNPGGSTGVGEGVDNTGTETAPDSQPPAVDVNTSIPGPETYDTGGSGDVVIPPEISVQQAPEPVAPQDALLRSPVDTGGLAAIPSIPEEPVPAPTPTPQPTPTPTPTPEPTPAPEPAPEPTPQPTPEPGPAPSPGPTPTPVPSPQLVIDKTTNGGDGYTFVVGSPVTWTYVVSNPGNVGFSNVLVIDNQPGVTPVFSGGDTDTDGILDPGETWVYTASGQAVINNYANVGTVTGDYRDGDQDRSIVDSDSSSYFGASLSIAIDKLTNGFDGKSFAVGSPITWTYVVTNPGNVAIANVLVTDSDPNVSPIYVTGDFDSDLQLDPGETWIYDATGTATLGAYSNVGTASGSFTYQNGSQSYTLEDTATDASSYTGVAPPPPNVGINIDKTTNGGDGYTFEVGDAITWTYAVTNTGNVALSDVDVTDNKVASVAYVSGDANEDGRLDPSETWIYTASGLAIKGSYSNVGSVSANYGDGQSSGVVNDFDSSSYFGADVAIDIVKTTNGADGGRYLAGTPITWTYTVTNPGNVALSSIQVTDDKGVIPMYQSGDVDLDQSLDPGETWTYVASGTAVTGPYSNIGTASGSFVISNGSSDSETVSASDSDGSSYTGYSPPPPPAPGTWFIPETNRSDVIWEDPSKGQKNSSTFQVHYKPDQGASVRVQQGQAINVFLDISGTAEPADWSYQISPATHFNVLGSQIIQGQLVITLEGSKAGGTQLAGQVLDVTVRAVNDSLLDSPEDLIFTINDLRPSDYVATQQVIGSVWEQKNDFTILIKENLPPISIDLDGDGQIAYLSAAEGIRFDFNDDGQTELTPWVAANDGLLAYDHNQDGVISEGREIVFTSWGTDETVHTDLQALARYFDSNQDGTLDNTDAGWQQFGAWQDAASDGQSGPGEFRTLDELGIASIDLQGDGVSSTAANGDVLIHGTTEVTYADGSTTIAQDITFAALLDQALADPTLLSDVQPEPSAGAAAPADTADLTALVDAFVASEPITKVPPVQDLPADDTTVSIADPSLQTDGSESLSDPLLADAVSDDGTDLPAPDLGHSVHTSL